MSVICDWNKLTELNRRDSHDCRAVDNLWVLLDEDDLLDLVPDDPGRQADDDRVPHHLEVHGQVGSWILLAELGIWGLRSCCVFQEVTYMSTFRQVYLIKDAKIAFLIIEKFKITASAQLLMAVCPFSLTLIINS